MPNEIFQNAGPDGGPVDVRKRPGCLLPATLAGLLALIFIAILNGDDWLGSGDDDCGALAADTTLAAKCPAPSASSAPDTADADEDTDEDSDGDEDADAGDSGGAQTSADLPADGVGAPDGIFEPPAEEDLPAGAVLYTGSSGGKIGCITCDGASRFLSIEKPGVVVGNTGMTSQATTWKQGGQILEFGANINGVNKGRYGINLFEGPTTYYNGCSFEIGFESCLQARPGPIAKGTQVVIIIGEGGTMVDNKPASKGNFTIDWWFVFQPD